MFDDFHKQMTLPDLQSGVSRPDLHSGISRPYPLPQKIGPYKIESLLNRGGMSLLYLGVHPQTGKAIVIKVLLPKFLKNQEIEGRFLKEAQIIGMTNHPNIVKLYGQGQWEKGLYIAMEFVQGVSLRQFIQQKSLSQKRALEIILQVAYALCHLHTHGVIHRDLKPENILITETGEIKVIDFGIAQWEMDVKEERVPKSGRLMGTPVYMSPEQKENPSLVTAASDIFSLGIIAYELVLGRLSHGVIHLALLPKQLRKIIETALKIEPKERYPDIIDFITAISQYIKTLSENEKIEKSEETSEEVVDLIHTARSVLIPNQAPRWPQVEMGIAVHEGMSLGGLYLDFFRFSENQFCIVLAEPIEGEKTKAAAASASLLPISMFRGMMRMASEMFFQNGKDQHPIKMLNAVSRVLSGDPLGQKFGLCLLLLNPDKDQLSFISCNSSSLWHIADGTDKVRALSTPNPPLGSDPNATFFETAVNWSSGDSLILHSLGNSVKEPGVWIQDYLPLSPQPQAEKILHHMVRDRAANSKRASLVLSIQRIF